MRFTWDPDKAASNRKKHGVSFEEAALSLGDPLAVVVEDSARGEARQVAIAMSPQARLLVTVHLWREDDMIHIISARRAERHEWRRYEEGK